MNNTKPVAYEDATESIDEQIKDVADRSKQYLKDLQTILTPTEPTPTK